MTNSSGNALSPSALSWWIQLFAFNILQYWVRTPVWDNFCKNSTVCTPFFGPYTATLIFVHFLAHPKCVWKECFHFWNLALPVKSDAGWRVLKVFLATLKARCLATLFYEIKFTKRPEILQIDCLTGCFKNTRTIALARFMENVKTLFLLFLKWALFVEMLSRFYFMMWKVNCIVSETIFLRTY